MHVDFSAAGRKVVEEPRKPCGCHSAGPGQAEHGVRNAQAHAAGAAGEKLRPGRGELHQTSPSFRLDLGQDRDRLDWHAQATQPMAPADRDDLAGDRRMQVKVLVRVDVIKRKPGGGEGFELGFDFRPHLRAHARARENIEPETRDVGAKAPAPIEEIGQPVRRQHRPALDQHQMQTDTQALQAAGAGDGVRGGWSGDHQARGGEDAALMCRLDGVIDLSRKPEIVGRDDDVLQSATSRRSRRNRKNSMPSRSRRFIISGLLSISPTIEAILGARK